MSASHVISENPGPEVAKTEIVPDATDAPPTTTSDETLKDTKPSKRRKRTNYPPISDPERSFEAVMAATEASEIPSVKFCAPPPAPGQRNRKRSIFDRNIFSMAYKCSRCGVLKRGHKCPPPPAVAGDPVEPTAKQPPVPSADVQASTDAQNPVEASNP
jgi:hypothetical protein